MCIRDRDYPVRLRRVDGWIPREDVMEQILELYEIYVKYLGRRRRTLEEMADLLLNRSGRIASYLEMIIFFGISEVLHHFLGNGVYFRFVDVRLFFIVIMGLSLIHI